MTGTEILLILAGLIFGAICFFVGYGIAKKKKIKAQVQDAIGQGVKAAEVGISQGVDIARDALGEVANKAGDLAEKI